MNLQDMKDDQIVDSYIQMRDYIEAAEKAHKDQLAPYREALVRFEGEAQRRMIERGAVAINTEVGTAYQTTLMSVKTADKPTFLQWVKDNDLLLSVDVRPTKDCVREFMELNNRATPPGVDVVWVNKVNFRRK